MTDNIFQFSATLITGKEISLQQYQAKVLLIVNTASKCGYTRQYASLQKIYEEYQSQGFEILAFPCNQFGKQEPDNNQKISSFCRVEYNITFPLFEKIKVKGTNAHPLYNYLNSKKPGLFTKNIKWNFTKFLIDRKGVPVKRYFSLKKPESLKKEIEKLLGNSLDNDSRKVL